MSGDDKPRILSTRHSQSPVMAAHFVGMVYYILDSHTIPHLALLFRSFSLHPQLNLSSYLLNLTLLFTLTTLSSPESASHCTVFRHSMTSKISFDSISANHLITFSSSDDLSLKLPNLSLPLVSFHAHSTSTAHLLQRYVRPYYNR